MLNCDMLPFSAICIDRYLDIKKTNQHFQKHLIKSYKKQFHIGSNLLVSDTADIVINRIADALNLGCDQSVHWLDNKFNFPLRTSNLIQNEKMITNVNIVLQSDEIWIFISDVTNEAKSVMDQKAIEERLRKETQTDALTGLYNRKHINKQIRYFHDLSLRDNRNPLYSIILLDLDHFKQVNDTYGHAMGDEVLRKVAHTLRDSMRRTDIVARFGGEEFLIFLPSYKDDQPSDLKQCCARIQSSISRLRFNADGIEFGVSCSIGAVSERISSDFDSSYRLADKLLYKAKNNGRAQSFIQVNDRLINVVGFDVLCNS
ncbi:GGDEF domain-containing protein [Photobacterium angustum]|uniref:diguanylate cyclase n=1 Tax=Photobacterium angustum TaxID=661 RepID=A0ABX5GY18_PHOAN|nr:GGDEF domain-containing protein [Photobacterium angustum]PSX01664.1 GGDEF domain-containing protein [Photobacterium angustum]